MSTTSTQTAQVWIHRPSGCLYAVGFANPIAHLNQASDEIAQSEVSSVLLEGFDSNPDQVEWINENMDAFDLYAYVHKGEVVYN
jgi:hypothetical protein